MVKGKTNAPNKCTEISLMMICSRTLGTLDLGKSLTSNTIIHVGIQPRQQMSSFGTVKPET